MNVASLKALHAPSSRNFCDSGLVAVLAFLGVNRLVNRFHEQEKALARHLYERGLQAQSEGQPERALGDFRAALSYAHDNFDYQLSLARALRDTGRTAESETYLISLWERSPQEGAVNLALGRLFAREQLFDGPSSTTTMRFMVFGRAIPSTKRRDTQFELIAYLLQHKAYPQAQAELITMASALPRDLEFAAAGGRAVRAGPGLRACSGSISGSAARPIMTIRPRSYGAGAGSFPVGPLSDGARLSAECGPRRPAKCAGLAVAEERHAGACRQILSRRAFLMRNAISVCERHFRRRENVWTIAPRAKGSI